MIPFPYLTWFIIICFYIPMSFLNVTWLRNLIKLHSATSKSSITTKLGGNTYKNEMVAYLHMTWPNHARVGKATAPLLWWKLPISTGYMIFDYMIAWQMKRGYGTFTKALDIKFDRKKTQKIIYLFFRFKIYKINATFWNELN